MDAGALNMLHNARNHRIDSVADGVNLNLGPHDIFVHQNGVLLCDAVDNADLLYDVLIRVGNVHSLPAKHIGRPDKHRIAQFIRRPDCFFTGKDHAALGTGNLTFKKNFVKAFPVLRLINAVKRGAEDGDAHFLNGPGQFDRRLAAELHHGAVRLFKIDNMAHVFFRQRLKIEFVRNVKIRTDRFGVIVDDDGLIAQILQRPDAVNGTKIKFNSLTDPDGAGTDHENFLSASLRHGLVLNSIA